MKINKEDAGELSKGIDKLLGRLIYAYRLRYSAHTIWRNAWSFEFTHAYETVKQLQLGRDVFAGLNETAVPMLAHSGKVYSIVLRRPYDEEGKGQFTRYTAEKILTPAQLWPDDPESFELWVENAAMLRTEVWEAREVLNKVIAMASTAGQLQRMAPDLMRYLPSDYQKAAAKQQRRSQLHADWATTDRAKVREAITVVAKAYLLDPHPNMYSHFGASDADDNSWAYLVPDNDAKFGFENNWRVQP